MTTNPVKIILVPLYTLSIAALVVGAVLNLPVLLMISGYAVWGLALAYALIMLLMKEEGFSLLILICMALGILLLIKTHDIRTTGVMFAFVTAFIILDFFNK